MKTRIMNTSWALFSVAIVLSLAVAPVLADSIVLVNGDTLKGEVVLLDKESLKLSSESFGELTVPRAKVEAIYLGDAKPPVATAQPQLGAGSAAQLQQLNPLLQDPRVQSQINDLIGQVLGDQGGLGAAQQNAAEAREGLKELRSDMSGP